MIITVSRRMQTVCERAVSEAAHEKKKASKKSDEQVSEEIRDERAAKLVGNARGKLLREKGEWVNWHGLRPAHRDREAYEEAVWDALVTMEDVECEEKPFGGGVRRRARITSEQ
jgi:hypothetical protein